VVYGRQEVDAEQLAIRGCTDQLGTLALPCIGEDAGYTHDKNNLRHFIYTPMQYRNQRAPLWLQRFQAPFFAKFSVLMKGLWQWGVQKANQAAAQLEQVVAPTLPPQQVFEKHWDAVVAFYATTHVVDETDPFGTRFDPPRFGRESFDRLVHLQPAGMR